MQDKGVDESGVSAGLKGLSDTLAEQARSFLSQVSGDRGKGLNAKDMAALIGRYQNVLGKLMAAPFLTGTIVGCIGSIEDEKSLLILYCNGRLTLVNQLPTEANEILFPGDSVKVAPESGQIIGKIDSPVAGIIASVKESLDEQRVEVDFNGTSKVVLVGTFAGKLKKDDRVILDPSGIIVVGYLGTGRKFRLGNTPTITWDDIGGLQEAKRQMIEAIELPTTCAELYEFYHKKAIRGVLLFGPPGCGKTMLIEGAASAMARVHGAEAVDSGFISVKGPEILDMYVGNTERAVRQLFAMAREHKVRHGYPAIIAIDEAEALLSRRGTGKSSDMEKTVVPAFLAEMQGMEDSSALVILSTNREDTLDPAIIRDGRIDRNIQVTRPDRNATQEIFRLNLKNVPLAGMSLVEATEAAANEFYSPELRLYDVKRRDGSVLSFTLANLVNGAMIAGVVDKATSVALARDREAQTKTGLKQEDLKQAVRQTFNQKLPLNHSDELREFVHDFSDEITANSIQQVRQATKS